MSKYGANTAQCKWVLIPALALTLLIAGVQNVYGSATLKNTLTISISKSRHTHHTTTTEQQIIPKAIIIITTRRTRLSNVFKFMVKVTETSMSMYAIRKSSIVPSLNVNGLTIVRDITS